MSVDPNDRWYYATYYNSARTHLSINKDAPSPRTVHAVGAFCLRHFLADFIICMCEFDFRQAQVTALLAFLSVSVFLAHAYDAYRGHRWNES